MGKKKRRKPRSVKTAGPNSPLFMHKADDLFSDQQRARVGRCEITGCLTIGKPRKDGLEVVGLDLHHLIRRGRLLFRYDPNNVVILCKSHHGSHPNFRHRQLCAHGSMDVFEAFLDWLKEAKPDQFQWYEENKHDKRQPEWTYQEKYEELK